jgi:hypothetical protein
MDIEELTDIYCYVGTSSQTNEYPMKLNIPIGRM